MQSGYSSREKLTRTHALIAIVAMLFALIALSKSIYANPPVPDQCDELFEERDVLEQAKAAFECYESALKATNQESEIRRLQEGAFRSVAWLYTHLNTDAEKIAYVNRGLAISAQAIEKKPKDAIGYYWDAVLTSLFCQVADKGKMIPGCILGSKKEVISNLESTRKLELPLEGAGGSRILGIFLTRLPKIVGGNKKRGEELLTEALTQAPNYSTNFLELGRFLLDEKRNAEGKKVLNDFLGLNCLAMNPNRALECEFDQSAAKKLLGL